MVTLVEVPEDAHVEGYVGDTLAFSLLFLVKMKIHHL